MVLFIIILLHLSSLFYNSNGKRVSPGGGCPLPKQPEGGFYEVAGCSDGDFSSKCRKVPGTIVSNFAVLTYSCNPGLVLQESDRYPVCFNGVWNPEPSDCLKLCKGLSSNSLELQCFYNGEKVDCGQSMMPRSKVSTKCIDPTYYPSDFSASFNVTECLSDGNWAKELYKCVPGCGMRNIINDTTTHKGAPLDDRSEFPWNAGLYFQNGQGFNHYCGGSVIHPKAVLTNANCVYNSSSQRTIDERKLRVAVGKNIRDWNTETAEQSYMVKQISIQDKLYLGYATKYENDVAILVLDRFINIEAMPICLDKGEHLSLHKESNAVGTVVRRNKTSDGSKVATFKVLNFDDCLKKLKEYTYNQKTLSNTNNLLPIPNSHYDKFCAKLSNDPALLKSDIGKALTFPRFTYGIEQHFIYGIVSTVYPIGIVAFTNVTVHEKWINTILSTIF